MNSNDHKKTAPVDETENEDLPFVNEECGDSMWDDVLKDAEERAKKTGTPTPDEDSKSPAAEK